MKRKYDDIRNEHDSELASKTKIPKVTADESDSDDEIALKPKKTFSAPTNIKCPYLDTIKRNVLVMFFTLSHTL